MKPPRLDSLGRSRRRFWLDALIAAVSLAIVVLLFIKSGDVHSGFARRLLGLVVVLLLYRPLIFLFPPLLIAVLSVLEKTLPRREYTPYPCPKCGYDVRATLSRCPEYGTELRWGMLP